MMLNPFESIDSQDDQGNTPLHLAAKKGYLDIVENLIQRGANFTIKDNIGQKASDIATTEVKRVLLGEELNLAAAEGNLPEVNKLLSEGAECSAVCISPVVKAHRGRPGSVFFNSALSNKNDDAATSAASHYVPGK